MNNRNMSGKDICRNYCAYYKPGKNEDLSCLGSLVLEALIAQRGDLVLTEKVCRAAIAVEDTLAQMMCTRCPFYSEDCDYILKQGDALPCGGFIALSCLLQEQIVSTGEIGGILAALK